MWPRAGLLALCLTTFVLGVGDSAIRDYDEAYYAEAGREMVTSGDWVTPHYNFEPRLQKPILYYWLVAATYEIAGVTEWAARIWSALAGLGLAFLAFAVGRRWYDDATGWIAGAIVGTSFGLVPIARQSLPDVPLAFFVSLGLWALLEAMSLDAASHRSSSADTDSKRRRWVVLGGLALGLGVLTKGPVAVVLPAIVVGPVLFRRWRHSSTRRQGAWFPFSTMDVVAGLAACLLVAVPWYAAVIEARGLGYLHDFFVGENLDRFATARYNAWRGWDYIPIVIGGLLPWSVFGVFWLRPLQDLARRRRTLTEVEIHLVTWAGAPLLFFFVSVGSQPRYILPCLVPLAILLARTIASRRAAGGRLFAAASIAAGLLITTFGLLLVRARPLLAQLDVNGEVIGPWIVLASGIAVLLAVVSFQSKFAPIAIAVGSAMSLAAFDASALSPGRPEPVEVMAEAVLENEPGTLVCACGAFARSLNFYTHIKTEILDTENDAEQVRIFLDTPNRVLAVVDSEALAVVERRTGTTFPRLAEVSYLNTTMWARPPFLMGPDPSARQRVILISNR